MRLLRHLSVAVLLMLALPAVLAQDALSPATAPPDVTEAVSRVAPDSTVTGTVQTSISIGDDLPTIPLVDLTTRPDDLWQRIRNGFSMQNLSGTLVTQRQAWYLNNPDSLKRTLERSRRYLFYIVSELEKRGMPTEIALLPFVESSFNPLAYSPARALGMWQFIPSTGKTYNLQQNWWLDQRRDIVASTGAALDYLQYIYDMHGDWHLALASYNWGEGAVGRAVANNQRLGLATDYPSLKMPQETRFYVPALQALKNIIAEPQLFGLKLDAIPNRAYFELVERDGPMDIALAARLAEIPLAEFVALNPAYSRPLMPDVDNSSLILPAANVQTFLNNLQTHAAQNKPLSAWLIYSLKNGEKLDDVAKRYRISGVQLRQFNGINKKTKITAGMSLLVPGPDALLAHNAMTVQLPQTPAAPPKGQKTIAKKSVSTKTSAKSTSKNTKQKSADKTSSRSKIKTSAQKP